MFFEKSIVEKIFVVIDKTKKNSYINHERIKNKVYKIMILLNYFQRTKILKFLFFSKNVREESLYRSCSLSRHSRTNFLWESWRVEFEPRFSYSPKSGSLVWPWWKLFQTQTSLRRQVTSSNRTCWCIFCFPVLFWS